MDGFLLINKPKGITSFDVIRKLRKILNMRKIGHAGTLDPLAEGLMILALGEGTKLLEYLIKADKTYVAEISFGSVSDTYDAEGKITKISDQKVVLAQIQEALKSFQGKIQQIPPRYSALKINGQKAYELARKGEEVEMKAREVEISKIEILDYCYPKLSLKIDCGTGTYIRSIAHDLGQILKCGAYLSALRRTRIGKYFLENAVALEEVSKDKILPLEWALEDFEKIEIEKKSAELLKQGQQIHCKENFVDDQIVACLSEKKLISICKFSHNSKKLQPVKNLQTASSLKFQVSKFKISL